MAPSPEPNQEREQSRFKSELMRRLSAFGSAPILFVGSGISRRYLGLPDWNGLLDELATKAGKPIAYYKSSGDGNLPRVASLMVDDLHTKIWETQYDNLRSAHEGEITSRDSPLKILVAEHIRQFDYISDEELQRELELFESVEVDAIITTNFDNLLERTFTDFKTFVGQEELLFSDPQGIGEIYKIHGSIENPNSLVITEEDFEAYSDKYPYLAAKLMTFFAEHPVFFLGYSMSDPNITAILDSLVKCMKPEDISILQDRLFFVKRGSEGSTPTITSSVIATSGVQIPVISITVPNFIELFEVLASLERKFPAHILRRLKKRVYELVLTNDPTDKLYVDNLENEDSSNVDVVLGVGVYSNFGNQGYTGIKRLDLCFDVLRDDRHWDPQLVVQDAIPNLLSQAGNFPLVKYLVAGSFLTSDGVLQNQVELDPRVVHRFEDSLQSILPSATVKPKARLLARANPTFESLAAANTVEDTLLAVGELEPSAINKDQLKAFLIEHSEMATRENPNFLSYWVKGVCLYDRLLYLDTPWTVSP